MTIYKNLSVLEENFDIFIFDAYGVFWNGAKFYPGAREYMQYLIEKGKTVVVLSNSSQLASACQRGYAQKGLVEGRDYTLFVTSGQVCHENILKQTLPMPGHKYYLLGKINEVFAKSDTYQQVSKPEEADFVYISVPYLSAEEVYSLSAYKDMFLPAKVDEKGQIFLWDTTQIDPFLPLIKKCIQLKLPAVNANPDYIASEKHIGMADVAYVVRNGLVAAYYRREGGKVTEYGKPHCNVYNYVFQALKDKGIACLPSRTMMIGDTIRTDIKGALNAGIIPVLCMETGVTAFELNQGKTLASLLEKENINIRDVRLIAKVA